MPARPMVCFGELLLRLGAPGHELLLQRPQLDVHVGGAEANVAVALAHWGHRVRMVSRVSDNALGQAAAGVLRLHGVDTTAVQHADGRMGLYFLTTGAGHRPSQVIYDRADSTFARSMPQDFDWDALLEGAGWLHLSGVTPALGASLATIALQAARSARQRGIPVSFDGNFRPSLWERWQGDARGILHDLFAQATVLFADHRDMGVVLGGTYSGDDAGQQARSAAEAAFKAFPNLQWMACTQREALSVGHHRLGALLMGCDGTVAQAPAMVLTGIVDRIGGGDAFAAGVLHGLRHGHDANETIRFALAAGCLKHSIPGDFNPVSLADVTALLGEGKFDVRR